MCAAKIATLRWQIDRLKLAKLSIRGLIVDFRINNALFAHFPIDRRRKRTFCCELERIENAQNFAAKKTSNNFGVVCGSKMRFYILKIAASRCRIKQ